MNEQMINNSATFLHQNKSINRFVQIAQSPIIQPEGQVRPTKKSSGFSSMVIAVQQYQKLRKTVLEMKVRRLRDIFIRKLKQNTHRNYLGFTIAQVEQQDIQKINVQGIQIPQKIQHAIIILNFIAIIVLLYLTSFSATITNFSENYTTFQAVVVIKAVILAIMILHLLANALGQNFKKGKQLRYLRQILKSYIFSLKAIIQITNIINMILFIIFPTTMWLNGVFYGILCICFLNYASELIYLEAAYIHTRRISLLWQLMKILVFNILMTHLVATVLLAILNFDRQNSWITKYGIEGQEWYIYYIAAYYWGTIIITTIGFGDISAGNYKEQAVVAFLGMFSCIILGFNISEFNHIFGNFRQAYRQINKNKVTFQRMIIRDQNNNASIDPILKRQIYRCIDDQSIDKGDIQFMDRKKFLRELPEFLRVAYLKSSNRRIFASVLFLNELKQQTISRLAQTFNNHYLYPEEVNQDFRNYISILQEGQVGLTYNRKGSYVNGRVFDTIKVGKKQSLLLLTSDFINMRKQSNFNLITKTYSTVWSLKIQTFVQILKLEPSDYEYYFTILHQDKLDDDQFQTITCPRCTTPLNICNHTVFSCPHLSYIPIRNIAIYRYLAHHKNQKQGRSKYKRIKDVMFRTSVLKYYKNYLKVFSNELDKILREEKNVSLIDIGTTRHTSVYLNQLFSIRRKQNKFQEYELYKKQEIEYDRAQNYSHYFPNYNISNLTSTPMKKTTQRMAGVAQKFRNSKVNSSREISVVSIN